jgi:hypothetical protein
MEKFGQSSEFHFLNSLGPDRQERIKKRTLGEEIKKPPPPDILKDPPTYNIQWNDDHEKLFREQRSKTKKLFTNEVTSSSWNDLGFLPIL